MPITNLQLITVTGKFLRLDGTPAAGTVTFTPTLVIVNQSANEIVYPTPFTVTLNGSGAFSVTIPATNDPDLTPTGWTYLVTESITGSTASRSYEIELAHDLAGSTIDLADIAPVVAAAPVYNYALVNHTHTEYAPLVGGKVPMANLASGTPTGTKFIRDDSTLAEPPGGVQSVSAGSGKIVIGGTAANPTVDVGTGIPQSSVTNLVSDLASKVTSVTAASGKIVVGGTATAPTVDVGTGIPQSAITNLTTDLATKAPLASPAFTGTPTAPEPTAATHIATKNYVDTAPVATNTQTASYTLVLADQGKAVEMNVSSANTLTIPPNSSVAFPIGTIIEFVQMGTGQTTLTPGSGVTIRSNGGKLKTSGQYATGGIRKRATDEWVASGDLST